MNSRSSSNPSEEAGATGEAGARREVVLARLGRPRGVRGEISLQLETDRPREVLAAPGRHRLEDGRVIEVEELIERAGRWTWVVAGRPTREALADYVNHDVVMDEGDLPPRGEGEIDEHRLIGCQVIAADGAPGDAPPSGEPLGVIEGVEHRYEIDTWIIRLADGQPAEIPAVEEFIRSVDLENRVVTVKPEGILR